MDPGKIPFNALIVAPTNSGKTQFLVNQLCSPFNGRFDYIVLICPTFAYNRTLYRFGERDLQLYVVICEQDHVEACRKVSSFAFEGTNTLIVLDDCAASKDVKGRTGELVKLGFSARHGGISVWVLTQQLSSIAKPFRENVAAIVLFYTSLAKTTKAIFEGYAGELSHDELKQMISRLKERKFTHLIFSLRFPFSRDIALRNMEQQWEEAKKILSWREMQPGVHKYHSIEHRSTNEYGKPISVVTLERSEVVEMYYAPSSLYWDLKNCQTSYIKYEGMQTSARGYEYPVFKFAK